MPEQDRLRRASKDELEKKTNFYGVCDARQIVRNIG